ncbi:MAG: hypothetical protein JXA16_09640 [Bacteroidales bacterium]|nr:hypothetical protein [Bacteroidales bacterium]
MRNIIVLNALFILVLLSCNNPEKKETEEVKTVNTENIFIGGKTYSNIKCKKDSTQKFTAYFPENYSPIRETPVIVVFDAHARAKFAVEKFKDASNKYGYIIIASENIKNGLQTADYSVNILFEDVFSQYKIDKKRVYTAGFSGGAKIASSVAIYKGGIAGVIACGAGLQQIGVKISNIFDFVGIAGLKDFNYQELNMLCKAFDEYGVNNKFITFNGKHEWPDSETITEAIEYLEINAIKRKIIPTNDNFIRTYSLKNAEKINNLIIAGKDYEASLLYKSFLNSLSGLYDISDYQKSYQILLKSNKIQVGIDLENETAKKEIEKQNEFIDLFKNANFTGLKKEISYLKNKTKSGEENYLEFRLLNYTEMLSYIFTDKSLKLNDFKSFNQYLALYNSINDKNADKEYFAACKYAIEGNNSSALKSLNKAIDFGFYDKEKILNSGYFNSFKNEKEFKNIIEKIN